MCQSRNGMYETRSCISSTGIGRGVLVPGLEVLLFLARSLRRFLVDKPWLLMYDTFFLHVSRVCVAISYYKSSDFSSMSATFSATERAWPGLSSGFLNSISITGDSRMSRTITAEQSGPGS